MNRLIMETILLI